MKIFRKLFIKIESFAMRDDLPLKCQESDNTEIFDHALAETLKDELAIVDVSTSIKRRCELNLMEKKFLRSKLEKMKKFYCTGEKPVMHIEAIIKKLQL